MQTPSSTAAVAHSPTPLAHIGSAVARWAAITAMVSLAAVALQGATAIPAPELLSTVMLAPALAALAVAAWYRGPLWPPRQPLPMPIWSANLLLAASFGLVVWAALAATTGQWTPTPPGVGPLAIVVALQAFGAF